MKIVDTAQPNALRRVGGRPGHLARYLERSGINEPIDVLNHAKVNDFGWFARYSALLSRHIGQGESLKRCAADLGIGIEMAEHLVERIGTLECEAVGRHFVPSSSSVLKALPTLKQKAQRQQAAAIGSSLLKLTRKNATLVRQVVSGYSSAVNRKMRIVLTRREDAHFGRAVIELVTLLNIQSLDIRVVGFRVGNQSSNVGEWLQALGLPAGTRVHWVNAPNRNSSAGALHWGIEMVHRGQKGRTSGAFHHVMILAEVVEIWRLPFIAKRQSVREKDLQPSPAQLPLFDGPFSGELPLVRVSKGQWQMHA